MSPIRVLLAAGLLASMNFALPAQANGSYHVIKKFQIGGEGGWDYLACDSAAGRLYVSRSTRVIVVDLNKGTAIGEIPGTPGVHGIALNPALHEGYTSNGRANTVTVFDTRTLKVKAQVKVGTGPDAIVYDPATKRVFTFNGHSSDSTAIDAATHRVLGTIPLGSAPEFAVSDGRGMVFANIEDTSEVVAIDARALKVKSRWSIAPGEEPSGLAIDRRHHRLFSVCSNEKMVVLNADTGKVVATPAIGKGPDACVFDDQAALAFSSNGVDGTVTVVSERSPDSFSVVTAIPTQNGARTMALDPRTHRIYLATAQFVPGAGAGRRRVFVPGSFVILVAGP